MAGFTDFIKGLVSGNQDNTPSAVINGSPVKTVKVGSTGTRIFAGYLAEEFLSELTGRVWADKIDQIVRSDATATMLYKAVKLPIISADWDYIELDDSDMAKMQKKLLQQIMFKDLEKSFTQLLNEVLTCLKHGYSLFEKTYKPVLNHPELGSYNSLKAISYRSPRTIERWNLSEGALKSVTQIAFGDEGKFIDIDAQWLVHFCPDREGDNFEGISLFRGVYGNWLRKNHFLKLLAAGIEKYAIKTPTLKVPTGKENSQEYSNALDVLEAYTSNQTNYITLPEGWEITFTDGDFDSQKVRETINYENSEMMSSALASFLLLGQQKNSGNRALGETLSDFFLMSLKYVANHISEVLDQRVHRDLININFGKDIPLLVKLKCDGLDDVASTIVGDLLQKGGLRRDDKMEELLRKKLNLPPIDQATVTVAAPPAQANPTNPQLSEDGKKKVQLASKSKRKQSEATKLIADTHETLKETFKPFLEITSISYIEKLMKVRVDLPDSKEYKAALDTIPKAPDAYYETVRMLVTKATVDAKNQVYKLTKKKLSEFRMDEYQSKRVNDALANFDEDFQHLKELIQLYGVNPSDYNSELKDLLSKMDSRAQIIREGLISEFDLSPAEVSRINSKVDLLLDTQVQDLRKNIALQYQASASSTESDAVISKDLYDKADDVIDGPMSGVGSGVLASQAVNEARSDAADEMADDVESYTFIAVDDDRTTDICLSLDGRTFAADDPDLDRYSPPLHYNCRSYLQINLRSFSDNPEITTDPLSLSKKAQGQINLSEGCGHDH